MLVLSVRATEERRIEVTTKTEGTSRKTNVAGLPLDEFRCNHWGHEVGIINDQRCQRFAKEGERFCGYHLVAERKRRAAAAANPIAPEVRAELLRQLGVK